MQNYPLMLFTVSYRGVDVVRQVVLDGVLEIPRGVAEAAIVSSLMMGSAGYRASLDKVMEVSQHYIYIMPPLETLKSFDCCLNGSLIMGPTKRELFQAFVQS